MYQVIESNADFIVINKAAGFSVHKDQQEQGLVMHLQQSLNMPALSPVHRLDKVTSGLMVLACHPESAAALSEAFRLRKVDKFYLALSDHKPRKKQGLISGDMEKSRRSAWKLTKGHSNPAKTQFVSCSSVPGERLFLVKPLTGKTHQIRVALKSIGAPILGDALYHAVVEPMPDRAYLHAYGLGFELNGKRWQFVCPPTQGERFCDPAVQAAIDSNYKDPWLIKWPQQQGV